MEHSIPIPILGWNARDSYDQMDPRFAVRLSNAIPDDTTLTTRKGYTELTTGLGDSVETLATYVGESGTDALLAFADGKIYDINTSTGTATNKKTHNNNDRFKTLNINNLLVMVNGENTPATYDGTTVADLTITGHSTPASLNGVMSFKSRAYYWTENESSFWYAGAGAHTGALTEFGVDYVASKGGGITEIFTWTRDGGDGMDDLFVIMMNTGEVLVYQGSDPASDFSLIGKYTLGQPLSINGSCNLGSDRVIITRDGYVNLSTSLSQARLNDNNVGKNIINAVKSKIKQHASNYGWSIQYLPSESLLLVNVPLSSTKVQQHVMNTNTGAWCRFDNINSISWIEHSNQAYFGTNDGKIMKAFNSYADDGSPIQVKIVPAFNPMGDRTREKTLTMCTILTNHSYPKFISIDAHKDFNISSSGSLPLPPESAGALWDVADWDTVEWGEENDIELEGVNAHKYPLIQYGYYLTIKIRHQSKLQRVKYYSIKLKSKGGKA
ncbi:MAG: hypothetical protein AB8B80_13865 [Marinicellaceae bacterium]